MKRIQIIVILSVVLVATAATIALAQKSKKSSMETRWKKVERFAEQN